MAGGGTAGVVAALAAARQGAQTALDRGQGLHRWDRHRRRHRAAQFLQPVEGVPRRGKASGRQGHSQEIVDRLTKAGGCSGHAEMLEDYDYDSVCTVGRHRDLQARDHGDARRGGRLPGPQHDGGERRVDGSRIRGVIVESRSGRELFEAKSFVDCTAYGDLAAYAGAKYSEPNDYAVANSIGVAGVDLERLLKYVEGRRRSRSSGAAGLHDGVPGQGRAAVRSARRGQDRVCSSPPSTTTTSCSSSST